MNITYIIGNGFDVNLGLKTRYKDFYKYYEKEDSSNEDIINLKKSIEKDVNYWSDLEVALGKYTKDVSDSDVMRFIFEDLADHLTKYLSEVIKTIPPINEKAKESFLNDIIFPEKYLRRTDKENMQAFYSSYSTGISTQINFITLNYTPTIEKLLKNQNGKIPTACFNHSSNTTLGKVYHLHHTLEDTIILGVNDDTQIANEAFRKNQSLREFLIKPEANKMLKSGIDNDCEKIIEQTDLFILFGVSLGATDKKWWQLMAKRLKEKSRMILFEYDENFKNERGLGAEERKVKDKFLSYSDLPDDPKETIKEHIYIAVNEKIFSNTKNILF